MTGPDSAAAGSILLVALSLWAPLPGCAGQGAAPRAASPTPSGGHQSSTAQSLVAAEPEAEEASLGGATQCGRGGVALQILGSGGPRADDARASSGYLVWVEGRSRFLIDAGGGVFQRFGEAGARIEDLDAIALSHLHVDHSVDLLALLKAGYFVERQRELPIVGPSEGSSFPSLSAFLTAMLGPEGAYRYLGGYLTGEAGLFALTPHVVDARAALDDPASDPAIVLQGEDWRLRAIGVHHGHVPALGYLLHVGDVELAFAGDQSARNPAFERAAHGADILVAHHAIGNDAGQPLQALHRTPEQLVELAVATQPRVFVLSNHMQRALRDWPETKQRLSKQFSGDVHLASDLDCLPVH